MAERETRLAIPKNELFYWNSTDGVFKPLVTIDGSILVNIQSRNAKTIVSHDNVSVTQSSTDTQLVWIDCNGYSELALTLMCGEDFANQVDVHWSHDGTNIHAIETPLVNASRTYGVGNLEIKARYARVKLYNHNGLAPKNMSSWVYLKA